MMTSNDRTNRFRLTLLRVSKLLTGGNVQDLAFLCKEISPARREKLTNGVELFAALQGHDRLSEDRVNTLIEWLDELGLLEASKLLKDYRQDCLKDDVTLQQKCLIHDDLPMKYFCVSCGSKICPDCAYTSHNRDSRCDVIAMENLEDELTSRKDKLKEDFEGAAAATRSTEMLWEQKKAFLAKWRKATREDTHKNYLALLKRAEAEKSDAIEKLNNEEISDMKQLLEEREQIQRLQIKMGCHTKVIGESTVHSLNALLEINKVTKEVGEIKLEIERQQETIMTSRHGLIYRKKGNGGAFAIGSVSKFVGSVSLGKQFLNIVDDRFGSGGVLLVSVDATEPAKEYWRYLVTVKDNTSPVVMSYVDMWHGGTNRILFAVGKTIFIVELHHKRLVFDFDNVDSEKCIEIDDVPEGSWITSVTAHNLSGYPSDLFLISMHNSTTVGEYSTSGNRVRSVQFNFNDDSANDIASMAYRNNTFAVIVLPCNDVKVLTVSAKGAVERRVSLEPPSDDLSPLSVITAGEFWLVLYVTKGPKREWTVMEYDKMWKFMKEASRVTFGTNNPVCVSRWRSVGYVTLADMSLHTFKY